MISYLLVYLFTKFWEMSCKNEGFVLYIYFVDVLTFNARYRTLVLFFVKDNIIAFISTNFVFNYLVFGFLVFGWFWVNPLEIKQLAVRGLVLSHILTN